jgi:cobalt-zinc-cadmium efflux system outer membrane protein
VDELIVELLKSNPQIQATESRYRAALAVPSQARTLPDPVLSFVSRNSSGNPVPFTELGKDELSVVGLMWEQEFPYPGKLKLAGQIAEKEADSVKAEVTAVRWAVIGQLKQAYFEYLRAHRSLQILRDSGDLLKRFENIAEARYSVGEAIQQDVLRAQVEVSILAQRVTRLEREKASAGAEINQLLNRPIDASLPEPADVQPSTFAESPDSLQQEFSSMPPQIQSAESMVEREKLNLALARKQYRPDLMTSIEYDNSPNFPDMWDVQIGLRLPIFYKKKQNYGVAEATHNLTLAEKELTAMKQEVAFNIRNEFLQIQASDKLLRLYQKAIIPQSGLALESGIASYQVGKADFLTTLTNFLTVLEYRMNYFEELAKHEGAIARLEKALGRQLGGQK